ncbi:MAG: hypothetical protein QXH71_04345 [Candidatus Anstonellaceae archaeon]
MKKLVFFLFLFIFLNFVFSEAVEDIKISSLNINATCKEFWKKDLPPKLFVSNFLDGKKIYSPYLFYTLESLNLINWSVDEADPTTLDVNIPSSFNREKQLLKDSYSLAKEAKNYYDLAYLKYKEIALTLKFFKLLMPIVFPPLLFLGIQNEIELLIDFLNQPYSLDLEDDILISNIFLLEDYSFYWEKSISAATSSLKYCTSALNSFFISVEKKAILLYENGVEDQAYYGKPKEIYNEWKEFVQLSKNYSINKIRSSTEPAMYAWIYFLANSVQQTCNLEKIFPYFYPMDYLFNNACVLKNGNLLDFVIKMDKKMSMALESLQAEGEAAFNSTSALKTKVEEKIKKINLEEPMRFSGDEIFSIQLSGIKISNISGSIEELYDSMNSYFAEGQSYFNSASKSKKLVEKILLYKKSYSSYELAMEAAEQLEELLAQKSNISCSYAESELNSLSAKIKKVQTQKDHSLLANLLETYNSASLLIDKAKNSKKLSEKFLNCKKAYLIISNSYSSDASLSISEALLKKFLEYITAGEKMGADVSLYKKNYEQFKKLLSLNYSSLSEDIEANILSIKSYLNNFMEEESSLHQSILYLVENSKDTQKEFFNSYNKKLSQYRENNQWNLYAFKNRNALISFLRSSLKQLQQNIENYLKDAICKNANLHKTTQEAITVDQLLKISGSWESSNPFNIAFPKGLQFSCKVDLDISNNAIKSKSSNIEKVIISNKTLQIVLSSLAPLENIYINFSEDKKPFSSSLQNCLLTISPNNRISLDSNYTINGLYSSEIVQFFVPWDVVLDNTQAKLYNGFSFYDGVLSVNNNNSPAIKFMFPLNSPKNQIGVAIRSNLPRNLESSEEKIEAQKDGKYLNSYKLKLNFPQCKNIFLQRTEKFSNISNLKVVSSEASVKNLKHYSLGESVYWEALLNSKSDGSITLVVSFEFADLERWFNSSYSELLAKAKKYNDEYCIKLLESALQSFRSKDYNTTTKKLNEVKKRLDLLELKKEKVELAQQKIKLMGERVEALESLISQDTKKISTIRSFANNLKNAIESANRTLLADPDNSIATIEKANAKLNSEILKQINTIQPKAQKKLDNLISIYLDVGLDQENLSSIADDMAKVRELIISDDLIASLKLLYAVEDKIEVEEKLANNLIVQQLAEMNTKKINLEKMAQELVLKLDKYFLEAKTLEEAKTLFKPPLASKEVQNYKKPLLNLFKGWGEEKTNSTEILVKNLKKNQIILKTAQEVINSTSQSYSKAQDKLVNKANSLLATAKVLLNSSSAKQTDLEEKISKAQELINSAEYSQAIVLLEKLIRSFEPNSTSSDLEKENLPLFEIAVSVIFVLAIAYILLKSYKPKPLQQKKEIKTLKKSQEEQNP